MKILSEDNEHVVTCNVCNCVYKYEKNDLLPVVGTNYLVVVCPKCGQQMIMVYEMSEREADKVIVVEGEEDVKN